MSNLDKFMNVLESPPESNVVYHILHYLADRFHKTLAVWATIEPEDSL